MVLPLTKQMVLNTLIEVFGQEKVDTFPPPLMAMMQEFYLAAFRDGGNYRAKQLQAAMDSEGYQQQYRYEEERRRMKQEWLGEKQQAQLERDKKGYGPNHR